MDGEVWDQGPIVSDSHGLHLLYQSHGRQLRFLSDDRKLRSCRNLQSVYHGNGDLSVWFRSSSDEVGYVRFKGHRAMDIDKPLGPPTLLLPGNDSAWVEPLALGEDSGHNWQSVIYADQNGSLTHLQQASDTGHWHEKPLYIHHDDGRHDVDSYTINIRPFQEDQSPLIKGLVQIRSSSAITGFLNGRNVTLSQYPQWYETDFEGTLNFIIPTTSMACPTLTITQLKSNTKTQICKKPIVIDPSKKVLDRLDKKFESIDSWEGLKNLKTQSGKDMFDRKNMPHDDDLKDSFGHLQTLRDAHKKLSHDRDTTSFYAADGSFIPSPGFSLDDLASSVWHYIVKAVHAVEEWTVHAVGQCSL